MSWTVGELARLAGVTVPAVHLRRQHRLLRDRLERTRATVAAVEKEMEARQMGISLTPEERFELFGDGFSEEYEREAEERWGDTDACQGGGGGKRGPSPPPRHADVADRRRRRPFLPGAQTRMSSSPCIMPS